MFSRVKRLFRKVILWCNKRKSPIPKKKITKKKDDQPSTYEPINGIVYPPNKKDVRKRTVTYYQSLWDNMSIRSSKESEIEKAIKIIKARKQYYFKAEKLTGVDWRITGILHYMESGCNMAKQILNGESLNKKTKLVPKGWGPWESFEKSCVDAYKRHPFKRGMSTAHILYYMERFNGLGYVKRGINTPYLWSYTNHYRSGKYVEKKIFFKWVFIYKKNLVSRQIGAAVLLKELKFS